MNFIRLIDRKTTGALFAAVAAAVCLPSSIYAARNKIYSCDDASGARVFQDQPCGTGLKPWERDLTDRTRWSNPIRTASGCTVRSPMVSLTWLRVDAPITFDGGVALVLNSDESGIAATIAVDAAWPERDQSNATSERANDAISAQISPQTQFSAPARDQRDLNPRASENTIAGTLDIQNTALNTPFNRKLELSGNIAGQAIIPDGQSEFVVDSMEDPTRMRYGYRQTSGLLRVLKRTAALKFRLTLRSPEVSVSSTSLELNGLDAAVDALTRCSGQ